MRISFELEPSDIERFHEALARAAQTEAPDTGARIAQARELARRRDRLHARMRRRRVREALIAAAAPEPVP